MNVPSAGPGRTGEWRVWTGVQLGLSLALTVSFVWALTMLANSQFQLPLAGWHRSLAWLLVTGGLVAFGVRTVILALRFLSPGPRR